MDFIANATGSIFAQGWTPELQKLVGGQQDAAGLLKAVQARVREGTQPVSHRRRRGRPRAGDRADRRPRRPVGGTHRRVPWRQGIRRQTARRLAVRAAGPRHVRRCSSSQPLALTVQYSLYRWDGVGPSTWVGLANYVDGPERARARRDAVQRVPARRLLQPHPGRPGAGDRERDPARRDGPARNGVADGPVPAPGHPARRGGDHLGPAAVARTASSTRS